MPQTIRIDRRHYRTHPLCIDPQPAPGMAVPARLQAGKQSAKTEWAACRRGGLRRAGEYLHHAEGVKRAKEK